MIDCRNMLQVCCLSVQREKEAMLNANDSNAMFNYNFCFALFLCNCDTVLGCQMKQSVVDLSAESFKIEA